MVTNVLFSHCRTRFGKHAFVVLCTVAYRLLEKANAELNERKKCA